MIWMNIFSLMLNIVLNEKYIMCKFRCNTPPPSKLIKLMYPVVFGHLSHHWSNGFAHYFEQEVDNSKIETTLEILQVTAEHFKTPFRVIYNDPLSQTKEYQLSIPQGETRPKLFPLFNTAIELISGSPHVTWCSSARELTHIINVDLSINGLRCGLNSLRILHFFFFQIWRAFQADEKIFI